MSDLSFEPFGESLPTSHEVGGADGCGSNVAGDRLYRATIVGLWVAVVLIVAARVVYVLHGGNIFAFGN